MMSSSAKALPGDGGNPGDEVVEIRLGERCFPVSKWLLLEQSNFFGALFRSGMEEAAGRGVVVQVLRGELSARGLELVLGFIQGGRLPPNGGLEEEEEEGGKEGGDLALEELVEAACYLQVTLLLRLLASQLWLPNCLRLLRLAQRYGLRELREAVLGFMAARFHALLRRPAAPALLPGALQQQLRERHLAGAAPYLLVLGCFAGPFPAGTPSPEEEAPYSALCYDEAAQRWLPLAGALPAALGNMRGYGAALLDNYLFLTGGYRLTSQEIAAATQAWTSGTPWPP